VQEVGYLVSGGSLGERPPLLLLAPPVETGARGKILAGVQIGVPARWVTPDLADEVLAEAGQAVAGQRFRALPGRLGMYFVLGLCLESGKPYRAVLKDLAAGCPGRWPRPGGGSRRPPR
jgi:Insertion element 4 transposase N-terminal